MSADAYGIGLVVRALHGDRAALARAVTTAPPIELRRALLSAVAVAGALLECHDPDDRSEVIAWAAERVEQRAAGEAA